MTDQEMQEDLFDKYISKASIIHGGSTYTRTIWTSETNLGTIPVAEVMYMLWEIIVKDGRYTTGRSCRISY